MGVNGVDVETADGVKGAAADGANGAAADGAVTGSGQEEVDFGKVSIKEALGLLNATPAGLSSSEAASRLARFGPNKLPETSVNPLLRFLGYLWNPLSWAMEVAALLAIILLDYADFAMIVALLLLNAAISYVEEANADKAIKALAGALAPKCKVLRDGEVRSSDAVCLVPGDVIIVRLGDIVPADVKLLGEQRGGGGAGEDHGAPGTADAEGDSAPMQIDQAALTGESLPVKKFTGDVAFSGSTVKQGERHALVYATGVNTFFGRAAALIGATNNVANIQKVMTKIGAICLVTIGLWGVLELGVMFGGYRHACSLGPQRCPTLSNLLVIIVGGIPIAMPTVLSVTLALGAYQLAKAGAIVARMSAVEEMAGMDILCSDKTGTLTLNQLSIDLDAACPMGGLDTPELIKAGALSADTVAEEAIDMVLHNTYPDKDNLWAAYRRIKYVPFNPVDKFTMAVIEDKATGEVFRLMKGAPQVVLRRAHNHAAICDAVEARIRDFAARGYRALGLARAAGGGAADAPGTTWEFLGLLPLFDPPRHDTAATIAHCQDMGISVKMVTGDQALIGRETARQLGMGANIHKVEVLLQAKAGSGLVAGSAAVGELVEAADGFAEVFPEHKYEIVRLLQERNHMVGMTGDGVNDAPALKKADVGIAVHGATEAARGAADIVLTEPGLSVIGEAVVGARKIFQRMTTYSKYTVAMTFRVCFTFGLLTVAYNWTFPTILIVLLAVFNDGAMIALSKDRTSPSPTPNSWRLRDIFVVGIVYGLYLTLSTWLLFHVASQTDFFASSTNLFSLNTADEALVPHCASLLAARGVPPSARASALGGGYTALPRTVTAMQQCLTEQRYVRGAQLRTLIYNQVSISGQVLVFVVRTPRHSLSTAAGRLTYLAFAGAQVGSTLIAALGFGGYAHPPDGISGCLLCADSRGAWPAFWDARTVPQAGSEGRFTASVIGCTAYVLVAWVWSALWYVALDPLKWGLMWALNEEGCRSRAAWKRWLRGHEPPPSKSGEEATLVLGPAAASYCNPLGRVSVRRPNAAALARATVVLVHTPARASGGAAAVSAAPYHHPPAATTAALAALARSTSLVGAGGVRARRGATSSTSSSAATTQAARRAIRSGSSSGGGAGGVMLTPQPPSSSRGDGAAAAAADRV